MSAAPASLRPGAAARLRPLLEEAVAALSAAQPEAARGACRRALKLDAGNAIALRLLSQAERALGQAEAALASARRAVAAAPGDVDCLLALGHAQEAAGAAPDAAATYRAVLARAPAQPLALNQLGTIMLAAGDLEAAETHLRAAASADPGAAQIHYNLGTALLRRDRFEDARASLAQALTLNPGFHEARRLLGIALVNGGRREDAVGHFRRALANRPDDAMAHWNLAECLLALRRPAEALDSFRAVYRLAPSGRVAHAVGAALFELDRLEEAETWTRRGLAEGADPALGQLALGNALWRQRRLAEALAAFRQAVALRPDFADAHFHVALMLLARIDDPGLWAEAWREYEWRWQSTQLRANARAFDAPLWLGEAPLAGRTILLHAEQGLGDTIQFSRFVPCVAEAGGRVVLEVQPHLVALLAGLPGAAEIVAKGDALPPFDLHCPLLSLPLALGTRPHAIPPPALAVPAAAAAAAAAAGARQAGATCRVGVAWAGNPHHPDDRHRSIPLATFAALFQAPGQRFVALQPDLREGDAGLLDAHPAVARAGVAPGDFAAMAGVLAGLDLVITVDSAIAHLAASLGRPVWVLVPHTCDWRWDTGTDRTAWYRTIRLFRQPAPGDWASVLADAAAALATHPA